MNSKNTSIFLFSGLLLIVGFLFSFKYYNKVLPEVFVDDLNVSEVLINLNQTPSEHNLSDSDLELVEAGYQLIINGKADYKGHEGKRISINFVCTDCHSLKREFANEMENSPEKRLEYAVKNNMPFLPASTLWGIYNRKTFYNGDYFKKYGDLVINSRDTLANAVQLCSKYCSSGRYLEEWELNAIMHYFKANELKIKDLPIGLNDKKNIMKYQQLDAEEKQNLARRIDSLIRPDYPATFLPTLPTKDRKYGEGGNTENGKMLYDKSCLYCHGGNRVTYLDLSDNKLSAGMFLRNIATYNEYSLYQIIRHGTYPKTGRPQYMPLYTKEKMSDDQINDLVAYIKSLKN